MHVGISFVRPNNNYAVPSQIYFLLGCAGTPTARAIQFSRHTNACTHRRIPDVGGRRFFHPNEKYLILSIHTTNSCVEIITLLGFFLSLVGGCCGSLSLSLALLAIITSCKIGASVVSSISSSSSISSIMSSQLNEFQNATVGM